MRPLAALLLLALAGSALAASWRTEYKMHTSKNDDLAVGASASEPGYVFLGVSSVPLYLTPDEAFALGELLSSAANMAREEKKK